MNAAKAGKVRHALNSIEALEQKLNSVESFLENHSSNVIKHFAALAEVQDALVEIIGKDKVQEVIQKNQDTRDAERRAEIEKEVNELVAKQAIVEIPEVTPNSFILVSERIDGKLLRPGLFFVAFAQLPPALQDVLLGKKAGETALYNGKTSTIHKVYATVLSAPVEEEKQA